MVKVLKSSKTEIAKMMNMERDNIRKNACIYLRMCFWILHFFIVDYIYIIWYMGTWSGELEVLFISKMEVFYTSFITQ